MFFRQFLIILIGGLLAGQVTAQNVLLEVDGLIPRGAVWKYLDAGSDPGTVWTAVNFNDSTWATGLAPLGFGEPVIRTVLRNGYITAYFRHAFTVTNAAQISGLTCNLLRDDGAVVYLNGVEVARDNMPAGPVTYTTVAMGAVEPTEYRNFSLPASLLVNGNNVLAVEVHQANLTSSDLCFDFELLGALIPPVTNRPPTVRIASPTNNAVFIAPAQITLVANVGYTDENMGIRTVEFFAGTNSLGINTNFPTLDPMTSSVQVWTTTFQWANVPAGQYSLRVVVTDGNGATGVSAPVNIVVTSQPATPVVTVRPIRSHVSEVTPNTLVYDPAGFWVARATPEGLPISQGDLHIAYIVSGTADNGVDYARLPGIVTIQDGATNALIEVAPLDDKLVEGTETVVVTLIPLPTLSPATPGGLSPLPDPYVVGEPGTATVSIMDDETPAAVINLVASDPEAAEIPLLANTPQNLGVVTFWREGDTNVSLLVPYHLSGTASNGVDYERLDGQVIFEPGVRSVDVIVRPIDDRLPETTETVLFSIPDRGCHMPDSPWCYVAGSNRTARVSITDSDASNTNLVYGFVRWQVYTNVPGLGLSNLLQHPSYPDHPASVALLPAFEAPSNYADNYGARVSGWLLPPVSGPYVFYLASDDQSELYLSTDESPANKVRIAVEPNWRPPRQWIGSFASTNDQHISAPVELEAGRSYYIEAIMKEGGGGDNLAVTWQKPGDPMPSNGDPPIAGEYLATFDKGPNVVTVAVLDAQAREPEVSPLAVLPVVDTASFVVERVGDASARLEVNCQFAGTASNGVDYLFVPVPIVFQTNQTRVVVTITPMIDNVREMDETVVLRLLPGEGYTLGRQFQASATILDNSISNRTTVWVAATDPEAAEIDPRLDIVSNPATFTFTRNGPTNFPLSVYYSVAGTASNGVDYALLTGMIAIPVGARQASIMVDVIDDTLAEGVETVLVKVDPPVCVAMEPVPLECYQVIPTNIARAVILDDDGPVNQPPAVTLLNPTDGTTYVAPVSLELIAEAKDPDGFSDIQYVEFFDGNRLLGVVTNIMERQLTSAAGVMRVFVLPWPDVPIGEHVITARATDAAGAAGISSQVHIKVIGITDQSVVNVVASDPQASESGIRSSIDPGIFVIRRSGGTGFNLPVVFTLSGTAGNGVDYRYITNRVVIPTGASEARVEVIPLNDALEEAPETVVLSLVEPNCVQLPTCYRVGISNQATVTILDATAFTNFPPTVQITQPANGAVFTAPADVVINAVTRDVDGYANKVEFFADDVKIGESEIVFITAPQPGQTISFTFVWSNAPAGDHRLVARTRDNRNAAGQSAPVQISVRDGQPVDQELHVVGIYSGTTQSGTTSRDHELSHTAVQVNRPGKHVVLCLSAYEPVLWHVTVASNTILDHVILSGYYQQQITGIDSRVKVTSSYLETGVSSAYLYLGYTVDSCDFYHIAPKLRALTGLEISSFHGDYQGSYPEPYVIDAVQNDPRLASNYPPPVPATELPASLNFQLTFFEEGPNSLLTQNYTLAGPVGAQSLLPAMRVVADDQQHYYGARWHRVVQIDATTGQAREMQLGSEVPELSWPMGIAWDSQRARVLLGSLGGEGYLYGYSPAQEKWSVVASMENRDVDCLVYHAPQDALYAVAVTHGEYMRPKLYKFNAQGALTGEIPLPYLPCGTGPGGYQTELVSVGEYLVLLWAPEYPFGYGQRREQRMYLIDPRSGQSWLTYRSVEEPANRPPDVQITLPAPGATFPAYQTIRLQAAASDPDGTVRSVEFFASNRSLGYGQRLNDATGAAVYHLAWADPSPAVYNLTAKVTDDRGASTISAPVRITVSGMPLDPVVTIMAVDGLAREGTRYDHTNTASFRIFRTGATNESLTVAYHVTGTASNGIDYVTLPGIIPIPAGSRWVDLVVQPLEDSQVEPTETIVISILSTSSDTLAYRVGQSYTAAAVLVDDDGIVVANTSLPEQMVHLRLPAANGYALRLEASTNLVDWVPVTTDLTVEDGAVNFVDPEAGKYGFRYYRLVPDTSATRPLGQ